ncbi:MAG: glycosyltransferase [Candidatus Aenigmarchaeota archaeon]|nr:glycosyltransferase [Candidatus Aenigmarchaeota archaeon]
MKALDFYRVFIIVPTYFQHLKLKRLLMFLYNLKDLHAYEIIIVDDFSPDETQNVVENQENKKHQFHTHYLRLKKNSGSAKARTVGLNPKKTYEQIKIIVKENIYASFT